MPGVSKIYIYASALTPNVGGGHTILVQLMEDMQPLVSKGIQCVLLAPGEYAEVARAKGMALIPMNHNRKWFKRLYWENLKAKKMIPNSETIVFLSLQNTLPNLGCKIRTIVYLHSLQGFKKGLKTPLFKWREFLKNLFYASAIRAHLSPKTILIVQTKWTKASVGPVLNVSDERIFVATPTVKKVHGVRTPPSIPTLFFPALSTHHKNHRMILDMARVLEKRGSKRNLRIILTLDEGAFMQMKRIYPDVFSSKYITIDNLGFLSPEKVTENYLKSTALIFPSVLESFGLPLIEARQLGLPILCSDLPYAHEVLEGYSRVAFFDPHRPEMLADSIFTDLSRIERFDCGGGDSGPPLKRHFPEVFGDILNGYT